MSTLGIDPGLSGGLAIVDSRGALVEAWEMPTAGSVLATGELVRSIRESMRFHVVTHAVLEQVAARPGQGVSSMFKFGRVYGAAEGILAALGLPYTLVLPQTWQKEIHQGVERSLDPKERSVLVAQRLFPGTNFKATERCKRPHLGMVDAALIAEYGRRVIARGAGDD